MSGLRRELAASWLRRRGGRQAALLRAALVAILFLPSGLAHAVEAIKVTPDQEKIDITAKGELYEGRGDKLQLETAPGPDGYIGRMAVQAATAGTNPGWLVFALSNPTSEPIVRWLVAPRYTLANSRVFWPELDAPRISAVTPSLAQDKAAAQQPTAQPRAGADCHLRCRAELDPGAASEPVGP